MTERANNMARTHRNTGREHRPVNRKKPRRWGGWYPVVSFVVIIAAVIFAMSVFFKVSKITVTGNDLVLSVEVVACYRDF